MMRVSRATLRMLGLLVLAITLFQLPPVGVFLAALSLLVFAITMDSGLPLLWWKRVAGLKWFFAAIFVLYLFGGWRIQGQADWHEATHRVGVLITLVGAVVIMLGGLTAQELAGGLTTILRPLRAMGVNTEIVARRLGFTLDAVAHMQSRMRSLDRSAGFQTVAAVCHEAEAYAPAPHIDAPGQAVTRLDWILVAWPLALLLAAVLLA